jgi:DinB family
MSKTPDQSLLKAVLGSWDRNNTILVNLLRALPEGGLEARAAAGSPSIAELFMHIRYVRVCAVAENALEFAKDRPELVLQDDDEWVTERDPDLIAKRLNDSAKIVRDAVKSYIEVSRSMTGMYCSYDHPILLLQHMLWHEGYHLGQMKLALKATGHPMTDRQAGPLTWNVWRSHKA